MPSKTKKLFIAVAVTEQSCISAMRTWTKAAKKSGKAKYRTTRERDAACGKYLFGLLAASGKGMKP